MDSRISGFHRWPMHERRRRLAQDLQEPLESLDGLLDTGGLTPALADQMVENALGTYALPLGVALNFRINDVDRLVPMVVEEPSVIAAASGAALRVRTSGGFRAEMLSDRMIAQIEIHDVPDPDRAILALRSGTERLLALAAQAVPSLVARGGGPRDLTIRDLGEGFVVVHVEVDCLDAMGANLVNTIAEALGPEVAALTQGQLGLRILTNLCDLRRVRVTARVAESELLDPPGATASPQSAGAARSGAEVARAIERASRFAELDPYRAATHNKGILNGIDSVAIATGNDYRAIEAGAHAFAARTGRYGPLAIWRHHESVLSGEMELPLAVGIVGGTLKVHPTARLALRCLGVSSARELACTMAAVGLASNLAALRALATEGIQRGHMALHARSLAVVAGAEPHEIAQLVEILVDNGQIHLQAAQATLAQLRANREDSE